MLILIQVMKMQFNKRMLLFLQFGLIFRTKIRFQFALLKKMVHFSFSINTLKWYTFKQTSPKFHLLREKLSRFILFIYLKITLKITKHVATMYRKSETQNVVESNFQMFIKYFFFLHFYFNWSKPNGNFQLEKSLWFCIMKNRK
jgi:hypothetical protein